MRRFVFVCLLIALLGIVVPAAAQTEQEQVYTVQYGDTLYRISLRFGVSVTAIAQRNNIANINLIYAGQRLVIPGGGGTTPPQPTSAPGGGTPSVYIVVRGDTLGRIAQRFGTTVSAIAQLNGIANVNLIFVGQRLQIPGGSGGPMPTQAPGQPTAVPTVPGGGAGLTSFVLGGHIQSYAFVDQMRSAKMTWVKQQLRWNRGDPPSVAAGAIQAAHDRGFKILLSVVGYPEQFGGNPQQYYQEFASFLAGTAQLGADGIEVWNEPNIDREWPNGQVNGANYTQMLAAAYNAIKSANGNTVVISGAPSPTGFWGGQCQAAGCDDNIFISQMRNAGAANYMDCVGIHYNEGILPPTARSGDPRGNSGHYTRYYGTMVDLYAGTFPSKPLCFTELGYLSPEGFGPLPGGFAWAADTSAQEQAQWLGDAVRLSRQGGRVRMLIVWNVDFTAYGEDPQAGYAIVRNGQCLACATLAAAMP
ncbi:MAG: LysM peptidoglycan-binding domain-containing protein [Anaerolineae bacterium]|nr:LysM peptidoglycan-binding domain-containing protein [Anaerolineae bacterium]MDL1915289.1 LysM peptidoglycan-binding domain-containing protein [Anaerolineae bacterium CFX4]